MNEPHTAGLRERKRAKTRAAIHEHALRLFKEQSYEATTIEQIADAAEVSPSTFFRYFPTKEDVVLHDALDPLMIQRLRLQPPELSPLKALRATLNEIVAELPEEERELEQERQELILKVPELRAKSLNSLLSGVDMIALMIAQRVGRDPSDFEVRNLAGAIVGIAIAAVYCDPSAGFEELMSRIDRGMAHLEAGLPL